MLTAKSFIPVKKTGAIFGSNFIYSLNYFWILAKALQVLLRDSTLASLSGSRDRKYYLLAVFPGPLVAAQTHH
jgi:hypothetical protein